MSDLQTSVVILNEGLDLASSKLTAKPGSLLSCLNYEITDTKGLSRIDGYERYDGQHSPGLNNLYRFVCASPHGVSIGDIICIKQVIVGSVGATTSDLTVVGIVVDDTIAGNVNAFDVIVSNLDAANVAATFYTLDLATGAEDLTLPNVTSITKADEVYTTPSTYYTNLLATSQILRSRITSLEYPAAGLHYFRDLLYAVAPVRRFEIKSRKVDNTEATGTWTDTIAAGTWIGNDENSAVAFVINATDVIDSYKRVFVEVVESDKVAWDEAIAAQADLLYTGFSAGATAAVALTIHDVTLSLASTNGTLWYCKSTQKSIDDGDVPIQVGWFPINQGFILEFNNGDYASATIPKLERSATAIPTSANYWLTDGVNTFSCELVSYFKASGEFTTNDAVGTIQIRNIQLVDGNWDVIDNSYDLHSAYPIAAPTKVADITSTIVYNSLKLLPDLIPENARYEFVTANFYADADWDSFFGVNGVDRAFYYTGTLFAKIFTQEDETKDMPRHVEYHLDHLALGFKEGSVQLSVAGVPHSFSGDDGATDFGVGDRVTGLMALNGDTLGVFCEKSIRAITGSSTDNFASAVLAPKTGCIEYTLVNVGTPVYCNNSGIVTLEQSTKYGDFEGMPLSYEVNSWLRPRLNKVSGKYTPQSGVICAVPVRTKNQYRLYFKDGNVLTMTVTEEGPKFTTQILKFSNEDADNQILVPYAFSSETDFNGEEMLHFSHYDSRTGTYSGYVLELDRGWGFDGAPIQHEFETNWFAGEIPTQYYTIRKVRLHGITRGRASMKVAASGTQNGYDSEYNTETQDIDLPRAPVLYTDVGEPANNNSDLANYGLSIQLKFTSTEEDNPEPSHICQVLVLQLSIGGRTDG